MTMTQTTPPEVSGLPLLGNILDFRKDRAGLLRRGYAEHGPIFTIHLGPRPMVVLIGPEYQEFFFTETDDTLLMDKPYQFLAAMFGKIAFAASPETYYEQRHILLAPFQGHKMAGYVQVMAQETQDWLNSLGDAGEFEVVSTFERLAQHIAAHALIGADFRHRMGDEFWRLYRDLAAGLDPLLPPNLPLPRFIRRDRAKRRMHAMLRPIIRERRQASGKHDDFLQEFVEAEYQDGRPVTDEFITNLILALIFAGHETTAGQASWAFIQLLRHPDYLGLVLDELSETLPAGTQLDLRTISQFDYLKWAIRETERMHPSADMLLRYNAKPFDLGGYHIPEGWFSMVSPEIAHRLPNLWEDPARYDPLRFRPERAEDKQHRFALIGFGGGVHRCAGMNFALNEMTVILSLLLQQFELELLTPDTETTHALGASRPTATRVRYRRRSEPLAGPIGATEAVAAGCPHAQVAGSHTT